MWALGITIYNLLTGRLPNEKAKTIFELKDMILSNEIDFELVPSQEARHCLRRMLDKNPETRATVQELLEDDWVTKSGEEPVDILIDDVGSKNLENTTRIVHFKNR